ncbi:putative efflux pump antibiotic resistance protein [Thozetella sp. PMI_491]|nr:putative efflux pump antibiotic resistance protein [Thozetella sp. PMI_491]
MSIQGQAEQYSKGVGLGKDNEHTGDQGSARGNERRNGTEPSQDIQHDSQQQPEYPGTFKLMLITAGICLTVFCMGLDNTIITTAIPRITDEFHTLNDVGWYGSSYLLTTSAFQLFFGKIYTYYSVKWVFLIALGLFEVGSIICGAAPNSNALIIGRAIAGFGASGLFSGAILIIAQSVPLHRRPAYTGIAVGMLGVTNVAGPLLGGAFTDRVTWRWCFYINLPFGGAAALFISYCFSSQAMSAKRSGIKDQIRQLDLEGTFCLLPGIVCLLLALQWGGSTYAWSDGRIIALFVLFSVLMAAFVLIQHWKQERATVPPRIFLNRNVLGCVAFGVCFGSSFFMLVYYIPIWFQAIKGATAVDSGIMSLPILLGLVILSILAGAAVSIFGYYVPFVYAAAVFMSIGGGLLTTLQIDSSSSKWIGYQAIYGIGVGLGMQQPLMALQTVLPQQDMATGTATYMFVQQLSGSVVISVAQNVFTNLFIRDLETIPGFDPRLVVATGATEIKKVVPSALLPTVLASYNKSLTQTWYIATATAALSIFGAMLLEWRSVKEKKDAELPKEMVSGMEK